MVEGLTSSATDQGSGLGSGSSLQTHRDRRSTIGAPPVDETARRPAAERRPDARNPGDTSGEAIPVPIPNTEVKLSSAEDTERAAFRENRSSPGFLLLTTSAPSNNRQSAEFDAWRYAAAR